MGGALSRWFSPDGAVGDGDCGCAAGCRHYCNGQGGQGRRVGGRLGGVPPGGGGYFVRKLSVFNGLRIVCPCKIFIINELLAKYSFEKAYVRKSKYRDLPTSFRMTRGAALYS